MYVSKVAILESLKHVGSHVSKLKLGISLFSLCQHWISSRQLVFYKSKRKLGAQGLFRDQVRRLHRLFYLSARAAHLSSLFIYF